MGGLLIALFFYLALYTWNRRTGHLDALAVNSGLEAISFVLRPAVWLEDTASDYWQRYLALVGVAEENERLRGELRRAELYIAALREDEAELARLRALVQVSPPQGWSSVGTRVLAGRFGPVAALESVMIDRGYASGAAPGTPLMTHQGAVGRVLRASSHAATVLLITDPTFRVAVIGQESRVPGVLAGTGPRSPLEVRYVAQTAELRPGELLVTSGLDAVFPKGIPVARVMDLEKSGDTLFQHVEAMPTVALEEVEEAMLLIAPDARRPLFASTEPVTTEETEAGAAP